jgi:hypothetical protein
MWQAMRVMRRFTWRDLAAVSECGESSARKYIRELRRAEYIRPTTITNYRPLSDTVYILIRNTGPQAPKLRKRTNIAWDPNTHERFERTPDERAGGRAGRRRNAQAVTNA